jgi:flagellar protein FliO/FliZ
MNWCRSLLRAAACAVPTIFFVAQPAAAAQTGATGESTPLNIAPGSAPHTSSTSSSVVRTIVGLLIVVAVIYGLTWVLKQLKASKEEKSSGEGLASLATLPLGPNRSVHLLRSGREYVLVGVAEQGVTPLRTYTEEEALELGLVPEETADAEGEERAAVKLRSRVAALTRRDDASWLETVRGWTVRA